MNSEGTKLNDSAGLKGAGLKYRWKAHWELEAKIQQVFFEAYNGEEKQSFKEDLNWRVEFQVYEAEWWSYIYTTLQIAT